MLWQRPRARRFGEGRADKRRSDPCSFDKRCRVFPEQNRTRTGQRHHHRQTGNQHARDHPGCQRRVPRGLQQQRLAHEGGQRRHAGGGHGGDEKACAQARPAGVQGARYQRVLPTACADDAVGQQEPGRCHQRAGHQVKQARSQAVFGAQAHGQQQRAGRRHHQVSHQAAQPLRRQCPHGGEQQCGQCQHGQHRLLGQQARGSEDQRCHAGDGVHAHLGHDGKQRGGGCAGAGIGVGQPEVQRQQGGLDGKHHHQQQGCRLGQALVLRPQLRQFDGQVGHVQRARQGKEQAHGHQEERRPREVEDHIVQAGLQAGAGGAVQQEAVAGGQQNFKEDKQVEQVGREKGPVQAHQLKLKQRVKVARTAGMGRALAVGTPGGVQQGTAGHQRGEQQHQGAQSVQRQCDAPRRAPVGQQVDLHLARAGLHQQGCTQHRQQGRGQQREGPHPAGAHPLQQQQQGARHQWQ